MCPCYDTLEKERVRNGECLKNPRDGLAYAVLVCLDAVLDFDLAVCSSYETGQSLLCIIYLPFLAAEGCIPCVECCGCDLRLVKDVK